MVTLFGDNQIYLIRSGYMCRSRCSSCAKIIFLSLSRHRFRMLSLDQLVLFFTVTCFLSASAGPVMLSCMTNGGHYGVGKAFDGMAGASLGNLLLVGCSAVGLGILLTEAERTFTIIKWLGAGYLIFMGIQLWRKPVTAALGGHVRFTSSAQKLFWQSVGIAV